MYRMVVPRSQKPKKTIEQKIVKHLKRKYLEDFISSAFTLDDILDFIYGIGKIGDTQKTELSENILPKNPRIKIVDEGKGRKFVYNPPLPVKDRLTLLGYLKKHAGEGVLVNDVMDSIPCAESVLRKIFKREDGPVKMIKNFESEEILVYPRPLTIDIEPGFQTMYRTMQSNGSTLDDKVIEKYLRVNKLNPLQVYKKPRAVETVAKKKRKRRSKFKTSQDHVVLNNYVTDEITSNGF